MDAIIFAAGVGGRMGPDCADVPKVLLEVGGRTLLEWHVMRLQALRVARAHVVTGHGREHVAREIARLGKSHDLPLSEIVNPTFTEGSVVSLLHALPVLESADGNVLIMDGDVFYGPEMLERLAASSHPSAMLVDFSYRAVDDDPVLVPVRDGRPFEMVKGWRGEADRVGESVGFFRVAPADIPFLVRETLARTEGGRRLESLDEVLRAAVKAGRFGFEDVSDLPWTELDFPYDLEYAREQVLPEVEGGVRGAPGGREAGTAIA